MRKILLNKPKQKGFTLLEMITVIIILGVMSVGITSFIQIATQSYVNASERDELVSSARFSIERLNREIREALPSSSRAFSVDGVECLEFVPVVATSVYLDLTTTHSIDTVQVIEFNNSLQQAYSCDSQCNDIVSIYPLAESDVYTDPDQTSGQLFSLASLDKITSGSTGVWTFTFDNTVKVDALSPTDRLYIINQPVRFCEDNGDLWRVDNYALSDSVKDSAYPSGHAKVLMAENVEAEFRVDDATLTRNGIVQVTLDYTRASDSGETVVFNHQIHIMNTP